MYHQLHEHGPFGFVDDDDDDNDIVDTESMALTMSVLGCVVAAVVVLVIVCCCCRRRRNQGHIIAVPAPPAPGAHYPQQQFIAVAVPVPTSPYPPVPPAPNHPYTAPYPASGAPYPTAGAPYPTAGAPYPTAGTGYQGGMPHPAAPTAPHCDVMSVPGPVPVPAAAGWAHHYSPAPTYYSSPPSYEQATLHAQQPSQQYEKHPPYNPHAPQ